jgi:hypothetical protein
VTFEETAREVILAVVWCVLILRTPAMIRDSRQRPLWAVLMGFAGGALVIQSSFGAAVNRMSGDPQCNNLVQGLWGVLNMAIMLEFVLRLVHGGSERRNRGTLIYWAALTAVAMVVFYVLSAPGERFSPEPSAICFFTAYALVAAIYMIGSALIMTWAMYTHFMLVKAKILIATLSLIALGNATQIPFMTIRTLQRVTGDMPPILDDTAFVLNTVRFLMVPLGCAIAALEPLRTATVYWYRRMRIYPLWRLLRSATPELATCSPASWLRDAMATDDAWGRLHRRVVEIRDSINHLHDAWASPALLDCASRYANVEMGEGRRQLAVACWLAVAERHSEAGAPRLYLDQERVLLPESMHAEATARAEIRNLLRLHRNLRSRRVKQFTGQLSEVGRGGLRVNGG